jgi:hypothetical protein
MKIDNRQIYLVREIQEPPGELFLDWEGNETGYAQNAYFFRLEDDLEQIKLYSQAIEYDIHEVESDEWLGTTADLPVGSVSPYKEEQKEAVGGYEELENVLQRALHQASEGKGKERHAQGLAFEDQPMLQISRFLGTEQGMAFQACKKIQESHRLPTTERKVAELLGAINYIAGMVIMLEEE